MYILTAERFQRRLVLFYLNLVHLGRFYAVSPCRTDRLDAIVGYRYVECRNSATSLSDTPSVRASFSVML